MKWLNFSVDEELYKRIKIDVAAKGMTSREYLRMVLKQYLEQNETLKQEG